MPKNFSRLRREQRGGHCIFTGCTSDPFTYFYIGRIALATPCLLYTSVWDMDYAGDDRTVDTHIKCLRAKLGPYAKCIVTVRKVGYKFEWLE